MIKKITKIGNSNGILFDAALMDMAHLKTGDEVSITVHEGGSIVIAPLRPTISVEEGLASAKEWIERNDDLFRRLAR
jgi:antitoxin component of MazEF toxin-antitoxin module